MDGLVQVTWKKNCLDLPEKVYEEIILPPSQVTLRLAKAITRLSNRGVEAHIKLRQLSDGFQYDEKGQATKGETPKDQALVDLLEEYKASAPHRIVCYAAFMASVDRCVEIAQKEGWNVWRYDGRGQAFFGHEEFVRAMQTGQAESIFQRASDFPEPICFVGNPEAAGQGLTLTPSPAIIYYSNSFKSQYRVQSEDRIHRPGASKERGCKIIDLIHLPTDTQVLKAVKAKREIETITLNEIEALL